MILERYICTLKIIHSTIVDLLHYERLIIMYKHFEINK